jgi:hypothetical protein
MDTGRTKRSAFAVLILKLYLDRANMISIDLSEICAIANKAAHDDLAIGIERRAVAPKLFVVLLYAAELRDCADGSTYRSFVWVS